MLVVPIVLVIHFSSSAAILPVAWKYFSGVTKYLIGPIKPELTVCDTDTILSDEQIVEG